MSTVAGDIALTEPERPIEHATGEWAMRLFVATEAMLFALLFFSYFYLGTRAQEWPPHVDPSLPLALVMAGLLITSSVILHWAERGIRRGDRARLRLGLLGTIAIGALWLWHVPLFYDLALRYHAVHAIEHASFLFTGLLFWSTLLYASGRRSGGLRLMALATLAIQGGLLGALLLFAARPLYASHATIPSSWGLTPIEDQQIAGLLMWVPPGLLYLSVASVVFVRWMAAFERVRHARQMERP